MDWFSGVADVLIQFIVTDVPLKHSDTIQQKRSCRLQQFILRTRLDYTRSNTPFVVVTHACNYQLAQKAVNNNKVQDYIWRCLHCKASACGRAGIVCNFGLSVRKRSDDYHLIISVLKWYLKRLNF